ncbi:hypothetical protein M0R45_008436 [Rubus argutus]|uniref:Uncharacterized protein n=1 Tax=Rubus argutus TaxID=59490 RepID=A0AAW1Y184_RUBAR
MSGGSWWKKQRLGGAGQLGSTSASCWGLLWSSRRRELIGWEVWLQRRHGIGEQRICRSGLGSAAGEKN